MNLAKIKGLFIVDESDKHPKEEVKEQEPVVDEVPASPVGVSGADVNKMVGFLSKAISETDSDGFNYLKFKNAVQDLVKDGTPEESAMKSVFATAKTMGLTKQKLISSLSSYLAIVDTEKTKFASELRQKKKSDIADVQVKINDIVAQLTSLGDQKEKLEKDLSASKVTLNNMEFSFNEAVNIVTSKMNADLSKIKKVITGENNGK